MSNSNKPITGFYDEYKKNKSRQATNKLAESNSNEKEIIKINKPITVRTYGRVRIFLSQLLNLIKYIVISFIISFLFTVFLNHDMRTTLIEEIKNILLGG